MPLATRQLSALYLTAASAYTVAIILSHHPVLADRANDASAFIRGNGAAVTTAVDEYILQPGWKLARAEAASLGEKLMTAIEAPVVHMTPTHVAAIPHALHRVASAAMGHSLSRLAARVPAPRSGDNGLRLSEDVPAVTSSAPHADNSPVAWAKVAKQPEAAAPNQVVASANPIPTPRPERAVREPAEPSQMQIAPEAQTAAQPPDVTTASIASSVRSLPPPTTQEIAQVEERLKDNLTSEMLNNFELFLYVSKAANGPWSQRMFVFQKEPTGDLALAYNWPVSTGREKVEYNAAGQELPSYTPAGYYMLDPHRLFTHYTSGQWGEPMPYAMFFNWKKDGQQTGLAIHSATGGDVAALGTRASAGCVRLPPEAARTLFNLIKSKYRGLAPRFAVDHRTGTMSNDGILLHNADGHVQLAQGYKVLVFIEDYGGENVVAAMY